MIVRLGDGGAAINARAKVSGTLFPVEDNARARHFRQVYQARAQRFVQSNTASGHWNFADEEHRNRFFCPLSVGK